MHEGYTPSKPKEVNGMAKFRVDRLSVTLTVQLAEADSRVVEFARSALEVGLSATSTLKHCLPTGVPIGQDVDGALNATRELGK